MTGKILTRPRCDYCGERFYQTHNPFTNYFWGKIPAHCPNCGKEISNEKRKQLLHHDEFIWSVLCVIFITFIIVILIVFSR